MKLYHLVMSYKYVNMDMDMDVNVDAENVDTMNTSCIVQAMPSSVS